MAVQQSHPLAPAPPVSWRFSPLPTRIFGLLPDACSSESSDTELEQKQGLQEIEEERKLRKQQKYEKYRSFLEEQKHRFYLQQEAQRYEDEDYKNGYIQEECHRNGRFQRFLSEYDEGHECIQSQSAQKHNVSECVQEQEKYNMRCYTPEHETYQVNGYFQEQSDHIQEYQLTSDKDPYRQAAEQYVEEERKFLEGEEGCSHRVEQCYSTDGKEGVPLEQSELVGQQEAGEGGRLFCVVGPTGSACAAMSTLAGSSEGEYMSTVQSCSTQHRKLCAGDHIHVF